MILEINIDSDSSVCGYLNLTYSKFCLSQCGCSHPLHAKGKVSSEIIKQYYNGIACHVCTVAVKNKTCEDCTKMKIVFVQK